MHICVHAYIHIYLLCIIHIIYDIISCLYTIWTYMYIKCICACKWQAHINHLFAVVRGPLCSQFSFSIFNQKLGLCHKCLLLMSHLAKPHLTLYRVSCSKWLLGFYNDSSMIALLKMPSAASQHHYSNLCTFSMPSKRWMQSKNS